MFHKLIFLLENNLMRIWITLPMSQYEQNYSQGKYALFDLIYSERYNVSNVNIINNILQKYITEKNVNVNEVYLIADNHNNQQELLFNYVSQNDYVNDIYKTNGKRFTWQWLLQHLNIKLNNKNFDDKTITTEILSWLVVDNPYTIKTDYQEKLYNKNLINIEKLKQEAKHLEDIIEKHKDILKTNFIHINSDSIQRIYSFLPMVFKDIWVNVTPIDVMYLFGYVELANIPSPFPMPSIECRKILQKEFELWEESQKQEFQLLCCKLKKYFGLNHFKIWNHWFENV